MVQSAPQDSERATLAQTVYERLKDAIFEFLKAAYDEHDKILGALLTRRVADAEILIRAHIEASRAEIRHITLHRLSLAAQRGPTLARA